LGGSEQLLARARANEIVLIEVRDQHVRAWHRW
jgi:hypothetical protein